MIEKTQSLIYLTTTLLLSSCAYTPINLPKLPEPKTAPVCPEVKPPVCPKLDMPEPIPRNLVIRIQEGKPTELDAGGEQLIRNYAATRKAIKQLWSN